MNVRVIGGDVPVDPHLRGVALEILVGHPGAVPDSFAGCTHDVKASAVGIRLDLDDVLLHFGLRTLSVRMDELHLAGDRFCDRATVAFLNVAAKVEILVVGVRVVAFPKFGRLSASPLGGAVVVEAWHLTRSPFARTAC